MHVAFDKPPVSRVSLARLLPKVGEGRRNVLHDVELGFYFAVHVVQLSRFMRSVFALGI